MLKRTPLHQLHLDLGGKMTAFAGYQLPVHYQKGIIQEHLHCRSHAGFFDISHMGQCEILGDEAAKELERLAPSDIAGLKPGQQRYTVLTNDKGGVIDDVIATRIENGLRIIVNAACKKKVFDYLTSRLSGRSRFIERGDQALFALQGPASEAIIKKFSVTAADLRFMHACITEISGVACSISRSGYTGEDGFEISVANARAEALARLILAEKDVIPIGLGARDTLRLEAGFCLYGHELDENITPVEAGLQWLIKQGRNDFPGADTINRQLQQGTDITRVGVTVESKQPVREGYVIYNENDDVIGSVTSGSFAPSLDMPIAMALLDRNYSSTDTRLYTKVREHKVTVIVTRLPFIPHRYRR